MTELERIQAERTARRRCPCREQATSERELIEGRGMTLREFDARRYGGSARFRDQRGAEAAPGAPAGDHAHDRRAGSVSDFQDEGP